MITVNLGITSETIVAATEERPTGPVVLTLSAPISLSTEHLVAALYRFDGVDVDELADDTYVRQLVAESVVNGGLAAITRTQYEMADIRSGTDEHDWLTTCEQAITRVFGGPTAPSGRVPAPRRPRPLSVCATTTR